MNINLQHIKYLLGTNSTVDYIITGQNNFQHVGNFQVSFLTEFSDHSAVTFNFLSQINTIYNPVIHSFKDVIVWDASLQQEISNSLKNKTHILNNISERLSANEIDINQCMTEFSELVYDISYSFCGKRFYSGIQRNTLRKEAPWFDVNCRQSKTKFYTAKRN